MVNSRYKRQELIKDATKKLDDLFSTPSMWPQACQERESISIVDSQRLDPQLRLPSGKPQFKSLDELMRALNKIADGDQTLYRLSDPSRVGVLVPRGLDLTITEKLLYDALSFKVQSDIVIPEIAKVYKESDPLKVTSEPCMARLEEINIMKEDLESILVDLMKPRILAHQLQQALQALQEAVSIQPSDSIMAVEAQNVINNVKKILHQKLVRCTEVPKLKDYVIGVHQLLSDPGNAAFLKQHTKNLNEVSQIQRPWATFVTGSMACFLGAALIVAAALFIAGTAEAGAPISAILAVFGGSLIAAKVTGGVGILTVLAGGFFAGQAKKNVDLKATIVQAGEKIKSDVTKLTPQQGDHTNSFPFNTRYPNERESGSDTGIDSTRKAYEYP